MSTKKSHPLIFEFRGILFLAAISFALGYLTVGAITYVPGHEPSFLFAMFMSVIFGIFILGVILIPYCLYKFGHWIFYSHSHGQFWNEKPFQKSQKKPVIPSEGEE